MIRLTTRGSKGHLSQPSQCPSIVSIANVEPTSLERIVREATANNEWDKIGKIVDQLCNDYAYAVHQPHARNGGLIGLAAASIALGSVGSDPRMFKEYSNLTVNTRTMSLDTSSLSFLLF